MENSSDLRSTFIDCSEPSQLSPIRCNKVAYLMIIEYFGHFSIKHKRRYLNSQRISVSRLKWQLKIVNEYDQEIPQSQTADNPVAP